MAGYNTRTTKIGWGDYLVFWTANIAYGFAAAQVALGSIYFLSLLLIVGMLAIIFASLIIEDDREKRTFTT